MFEALINLPLYVLVVSLFFVSAIAAYLILKWKKIGIYIIAGAAAVEILLYTVSGFNVLPYIILSIINVGFTYFALQYPKENKAWSYLT